MELKEKFVVMSTEEYEDYETIKSGSMVIKFRSMLGFGEEHKVLFLSKSLEHQLLALKMINDQLSDRLDYMQEVLDNQKPWYRRLF